MPSGVETRDAADVERWYGRCRTFTFHGHGVVYRDQGQAVLELYRGFRTLVARSLPPRRTASGTEEGLRDG